MKAILSIRKTALACALLGLAQYAQAQVRDLGPNLESVPADLIAPDPGSTNPPANVAPTTTALGNNPPDLGEIPDLGTPSSKTEYQYSGSNGVSGQSMPLSTVDAAIQQATENQDETGKTIRKPPQNKPHGVERAVFDRAPVRAPLPVGIERMITLPAPAALHVPSDMSKIARIEVIDRTMYITALQQFTPVRIIAELIDSGQQIPFDLLADSTTASARSELQVFVVASSSPGAGKSDGDGPASQAAAQATSMANEHTLSQQMAESAPTDMVQLTRYAARQLYAPKRLATPLSGVQQVEVTAEPITNLIRGVNVVSTPVGQWRSGQLYVTAVLIKNRSHHPLEIPLEQVRGQWIAATAQHGRIGSAGSETDTTAIYLVCQRRFEACR
ncbi:TIGR03749 family integrating conjugative element protein [Alcaligenes faecalis]|uniref:TIGR03749 family integrating conjugative element protein n=1 Tax=Alcaligenes TaxID=507 RepID=UPI001C829391|nr:TIGR03749 family integrating conjugative element protein [Alcaligenes faecalis]MBX6963919.1 TIGR03749 family integrating conjugative element protein [Providencia rettgeri]MBX7030569.1 TIGR03749 family integrating conjugative element protein [Alcaligenes faecalis]